MNSMPTIPWEVVLRTAYLEGRANVFLLHGAVSDFQWVAAPDGPRFGTLAEAIADLFGRSRDLLFHLDGAGRGRLGGKVGREAVRKALSWARPGTRDVASVIDGGPEILLPTLERLMLASAHPCGVVLEQADLLLAATDDPTTRARVASVRRWLDSPAIRSTNNAAVLIVDAPARLAPALAEHPRLFPIEVGPPSPEMRLAALRGERGPSLAALSDDLLLRLTASMTLMDVAALSSRLSACSGPIGAELLALDPDAPADLLPPDLPTLPQPAEVESSSHVESHAPEPLDV
jgi:hypothetical protein